jgi:hypothetical protein
MEWKLKSQVLWNYYIVGNISSVIEKKEKIKTVIVRKTEWHIY